MQYSPARGFKNCWLSFHLGLVTPPPPTSVFLAPSSPLDCCPPPIPSPSADAAPSPPVLLQRGENTCFDSHDNWLHVTRLEGRIRGAGSEFFFSLSLSPQHLSYAAILPACLCALPRVPVRAHTWKGPWVGPIQHKDTPRSVCPCLAAFSRLCCSDSWGVYRSGAAAASAARCSEIHRRRPRLQPLVARRHLFWLFTQMQM